MVKHIVPARIGLLDIFAHRVASNFPAKLMSRVVFKCSYAEEIVESLRVGEVDAAFLTDPPPHLPVGDRWVEELIWAKGHSFRWQRDQELPIIQPRSNAPLPTAMFDKVRHRVIVEGSWGSCRTAAEQGLGIIAVPAKDLRPTLSPFTDCDLPTPLPLIAALCISVAAKKEAPADLLGQLSSALRGGRGNGSTLAVFDEPAVTHPGVFC